jgi:hypothetical protein
MRRAVIVAAGIGGSWGHDRSESAARVLVTLPVVVVVNVLHVNLCAASRENHDEPVRCHVRHRHAAYELKPDVVTARLVVRQPAHPEHRGHRAVADDRVQMLVQRHQLAPRPRTNGMRRRMLRVVLSLL